MIAESTFGVPTAFCPHCRHSIERAVSNLTGVAEGSVDLQRQVVTVRYDPAALDEGAIRQRIEGAGFPVAP